MATWDELRTHAEETFGPFSLDTGAMFAVDLSYAEGRTQKVFARRIRAGKREFFELRTLVCRQVELDPIDALGRNAKGGVGFLGLEDGMYFLMHRLPLGSLLSFELFDRPLRAIAADADALEQAFSAGNDMF